MDKEDKIIIAVPFVLVFVLWLGHEIISALPSELVAKVTMDNILSIAHSVGEVILMIGVGCFLVYIAVLFFIDFFCGGLPESRREVKK